MVMIEVNAITVITVMYEVIRKCVISRTGVLVITIKSTKVVGYGTHPEYLIVFKYIIPTAIYDAAMWGVVYKIVRHIITHAGMVTTTTSTCKARIYGWRVDMNQLTEIVDVIINHAMPRCNPWFHSFIATT